jgi:DNA-binding transcriptional MerR regulator
VVTTYRLNELAQACGVTPRTIRYYVQRGLLPAPVLRGPETSYDHEHLVRLQAIKRLQERFWSLDAIADQLGTLSGQALEDWVAALEQAPTAPPEATVAEATTAQATPSAPAGPPREVPTGSRWSRHVLGPGLELHLAEDAPPEMHRLAAEILARIRPSP